MRPRGTRRSELLSARRQAGNAHRPWSRGTDRRGQIPNRTPFADRPAEVASRTVPGNWEGALLKAYDRGKVMAPHEQFAERLAIRIVFADPHSPWPRGTNETTNGLLCHDLPKGTDL